MPIDYWYSTCGYESPRSPYEFDVRDLPGYQPHEGNLPDHADHVEVIKAAIRARLLKQDEPYRGTTDD